MLHWRSFTCCQVSQAGSLRSFRQRFVDSFQNEVAAIRHLEKGHVLSVVVVVMHIPSRVHELCSASVNCTVLQIRNVPGCIQEESVSRFIACRRSALPTNQCTVNFMQLGPQRRSMTRIPFVQRRRQPKLTKACSGHHLTEMTKIFHSVGDAYVTAADSPDNRARDRASRCASRPP